VERGEEWHWTLRLKSSPACMIGSTSLMSKENNNRAFWLGLPWQRRGHMREACEAVTDYWFDVKIVLEKQSSRNAAGVAPSGNGTFR
jgi:ribosomal-protein-alanine N-acetyltransferase